MNANTQNLIAGAIGAIVLNAIHGLAKKTIKNAPKIDEVGKEGVTKAIRSVGLTLPSEQVIENTTTTFNLVTNTLSYRMIGEYKSKNLLLAGALHGLTVGLGTLSLSKKLNLDERPVTKTFLTECLTVTWYVLGGMATAMALKVIRSKSS
ncbi:MULTISPECIES: hypothetical protein [Sphingobacterium]|uniref:hypothetical protein n=1 Tax=Sphingobacterium TaxID=28453 RepID=UPI0013DA13FD|nr:MULTISPECIES: hypothetical protein [unclassified Sphingobacterium]